MKLWKKYPDEKPDLSKKLNLYLNGLWANWLPNTIDTYYPIEPHYWAYEADLIASIEQPTAEVEPSCDVVLQGRINDMKLSALKWIDAYPETDIGLYGAVELVKKHSKSFELFAFKYILEFADIIEALQQKPKAEPTKEVLIKEIEVALDETKKLKPYGIETQILLTKCLEELKK